MDFRRISLLLTLAALGGLICFPPVLFSASILLFGGLLFGAGLCLLASGRGWEKEPQLFVSSWVLLGLPLLLTGLARDFGALGGLPWLALGLLAFFLGQLLLHEEPGPTWARRLLAGLALLQAGMAFYQAWIWAPSMLGDTALSPALRWVLLQNRPRGTLLNANLLASFLIFSLPWVAVGRESRLGWKVLRLCGLAAGLLTLLVCESLGALFCLAMALAFLSLLFPNRIPRRRLAGWLLPLALGLAAILWKRDLLSQWGLDQSFSGRLSLWLPALRAWLGSFWLGYGPGLTEAPYRLGQSLTHRGFGAYPHNLLLHWLMMFGLVGGLAGCAWLALAGVRAWRGLRAGGSQALGLGLAAGVLAAGLHTLTEMSAHMPEIWLWILAGLGALMGPRPAIPRLNFPAPAWLRLRPSPGRVIWALAFGAAAVLLWRGGLMGWQLVAAALLLGAAMVAHLRQGGSLLPRDPLERLSLVLLAWLGLGCLWSLQPFVSQQYLAFLAMGWLAFKILRETPLERPWAWLAGLQLAACLLVLAILFWLALGLWNSQAPYSLSALSSAIRPFFPNQNLLAGFFAPLLLLAATEWWRGQNRTWNAYVLFCLGCLLLLTGSRGALLSLAGALAWLGLRLGRLEAPRARRRAWLAALGLLAVLAGGALLPFSGFWLRAHAHDPLLYGRLHIWAQAWDLFRQKPLQGWGPGVFGIVSDQAGLALPLGTASPLARFALRAEFAHQEWLQAAVEWGAGGLLAALGCLALMAVGLRRKPVHQPMHAGLEAALLAIGLQSAVDFNLHCPLIFLLAVVLLALRFPVVRQPREVAPPMAWNLAALALSLALVLSLAACCQSSLKAAAPADKLAWARRGLALAPQDGATRIQWADAEVEAGFQGAGLWAFRQAMQAYQQAVLEAPEWAPARAAYFHFLGRAPDFLVDEDLESLGPVDLGWEEVKARKPGMPVNELFLEMALREANACLAASPDDLNVAVEKAVFLLRAEREAEAGQALEKALQIEPLSGRAWELKARLSEEMGDEQGFYESLKQLQAIRGMQAPDPYSQSLKQADWDWVDLKWSALGSPRLSP